MTDRQRGILLSHQTALLSLLSMPQNRVVAQMLVDTLLDDDFLADAFKEHPDDYRDGFAGFYKKLKDRVAEPEDSS